MAIGIDPTVDYAFKRLFGDPKHIAVLEHLLNAIFKDQFEVGSVDILTPFLEKDFDDDKLAVLDLRVRDTRGRNYFLEMQTTLVAGLPNRLAYYLSSIYSGQMREGDSYASLMPAIGICILNQILLPATTTFHTRFRLSSLKERLELSDQLEIHLLELPKYNGSLADLPHANPTERWAYFFRHAAQMTTADIRRVLPGPEFAEAGGVLDMIAQTPEERIRYEQRIKAIADWKSNFEEAEQRGIKLGEQRGEQRGEQLGLQKGRREILQNQVRLFQELLEDAVSPVQEIETWDFEHLTAVVESLQQRLRARN